MILPMNRFGKLECQLHGSRFMQYCANHTTWYCSECYEQCWACSGYYHPQKRKQNPKKREFTMSRTRPAREQEPREQTDD